MTSFIDFRHPEEAILLLIIVFLFFSLKFTAGDFANSARLAKCKRTYKINLVVTSRRCCTSQHNSLCEKILKILFLHFLFAR